MSTIYTLEAINKSLASSSTYPYRSESSYAISNAQRNLNGRTHYVNDDTLRAFKCNILRSKHTDNGLFFIIQESLPVGSFEGKRMRRTVVFDIYGAVFSDKINEIDREIAHANADKADKHYYKTVGFINSRELALASELIEKRLARDLRNTEEAIKALNS